MDLKNIFSRKEKRVDEYYLSVIIEPKWVNSGIWRIINDRVEVISFGLNIAWHDNQDLTDALDSSLSVAVEKLPDDTELQKTILGLTPSWLEKDSIKFQYQGEIKKVCESLSLKPIGFVSLTEAISCYLKSQEGDLLNGIIVYFDQDKLEVSLFVNGENRGENEVLRSVSLADDLIEGLTRFSFEEPLPSRFILYDGRESEIEDVRQSLLGINWDEYQNVKFLHPPKVEVIGPEDKILAVSLAAGIELVGAKEVKIAQVVSDFKESVEPDDDEVRKLSGKTNVSEFTPGEVVEDVRGVMKDQEMDERDLDLNSENQNQKSLHLLAKSLFDRFGKLISWISSLSLAFVFKKKSLVYAALGILSLLVVGFLCWWFLPSAVVKIYVSPQRIEESLEIELDKSANSADVASKIIPAREIKWEASGDKTIPVTGKKLIGDKAKGKVRIYRVGDELNLAKGTKLQSSSGLVFVLDEDVEIASGSASTPSSTEGAVSAFDIGVEYNLAAGETFSVGNYAISTIEAKNEEPFSGGSSREISAVSAKDYENILLSLEEELTGRILSEVEAKLSENEMLVKESAKKEIKEKTYDHKVGDETDSLKLSLTLSAVFLVVDKNDFYDFAKEIFKEKIPSGYTLRQDQLKASFSYDEEKEGKVVFKTSFVANLLPKINQEEIAKSIAGRSPETAKDFLIEVKGYDRAEINIRPNFGVQKLLVLPHIYKRIQIEVEASP